MGLDSNGTKFLFAAHAAGVSFRQTAMLGRQNFFPEPAQLQRLLDLRQTGLSAVEFLADSQSYAEKFLEFLGAEEAVAIDNSDYEGAAIVTDLNAPIDASLKERFSVVLDGGCLEHIFNFPQAIRNCMEMLQSAATSSASLRPTISAGTASTNSARSFTSAFSPRRTASPSAPF